MIVVEKPDEAYKLINKGVKAAKIIIGRLHYVDGCQRFLSCVFVNHERIESLNKLLIYALPVICQDLPNNPPFKITEKMLRIGNLV